MTITVPEPRLEDVQQHSKEKGDERTSNELVLDGGFEAPDSNAFGHAFRDYEKESERQAGVEEFYRTQHINQTYDYVGLCGKRRSTGYDGHIW